LEEDLSFPVLREEGESKQLPRSEVPLILEEGAHEGGRGWDSSDPQGRKCILSFFWPFFSQGKKGPERTFTPFSRGGGRMISIEGRAGFWTRVVRKSLYWVVQVRGRSRKGNSASSTLPRRIFILRQPSFREKSNPGPLTTAGKEKKTTPIG